MQKHWRQLQLQNERITSSRTSGVRAPSADGRPTALRHTALAAALLEPQNGRRQATDDRERQQERTGEKRDPQSPRSPGLGPVRGAVHADQRLLERRQSGDVGLDYEREMGDAERRPDDGRWYCAAAER